MVSKQQNFTVNMTEIFQTPCVPAHVAAVLSDPDKYKSQLISLIQSGSFSVMPTNVRSTILVALHATSQHKTLSEVLMPHCEVTDIVRALEFLDQKRVTQQLSRKIQKIENNHPHLLILPEEEESSTDVSSTRQNNKKRKSRRKVDVYRRKLRALEATMEDYCQNCSSCVKEAHADSAVQEIIQSAPGTSGALARKVRHWIKSTLTRDALEFKMLAMPDKTIWKRLADLVHCVPSDFAEPSFLADIYGEKIPESSFVARLRAFLEQHAGYEHSPEATYAFLALAEEFPQVYLAYPFLRLQKELMTKEVVENLAAHVPLETVLWNFEEFYRVSSQCEMVVRDRLARQETGSESGNTKLTTFGKLMERILKFRSMGLTQLADALIPLAAGRLEELKAYWSARVKDKKVAVIGDASASMQCAIESATIFASLVSVCFHGMLSFYNKGPVPSPHRRPQNVEEALEVCSKVRANYCTSPASALWEYVEKKIRVDLFVHVTDEEENTRSRSQSHASILALYKKEVNPDVKLVVVCVGSGYRPFRQDLKAHGIDYKTVTIDGYRPDLAKFDALLGQIAMALASAEGDEDPLSSQEVQDQEFVLV